MTEREQVLKVTKIVHLGITAGPAVFLGIVVFLVHREESALGANETAPMISYVSAAVALMSLGMFPVIPRAIRAQGKDPLRAFQTASIVRAAMLEMPALLGCVAYMLEGKETPFGAAVALTMILFLAGSMPTGPRLDAWFSARGASPGE